MPVIRDTLEEPVKRAIEISPRPGRINRDHAGQPVLFLPDPGSLEPAGHAEIIPADDAVLDEPAAAFGYLLLDLAGMFETARISDRDGARGAVREIDPIELLLDCLPRFNPVDVARDEQQLDDLASDSGRIAGAVNPGRWTKRKSALRIVTYLC
ncbi:MAG: hypothetical protein OXI01_17640 [Albidovulum sp.]|nr:hypothetical protein [Albidovulum sp.]